MNNHFGIPFPPLYPKFKTMVGGGTATAITAKTYVLATFPAPTPAYYLVSVKGVLQNATGLNNNNIHLIVSQSTTPDPIKLSSFAFQSLPEWNNGTTILGVSVCDTILIEGNTDVSLFLYDAQVGGGEQYDFTWSDVLFAPIAVYA